MLILPLVLLFALGAGVFTSFGLSQLLPTFHDARSLREVAQRPVLGTVSLLTTPRSNRARRRGRMMFAGGVAGLVAVYGAAMLLLSFAGPHF